jgi:hypothetical protein
MFLGENDHSSLLEAPFEKKMYVIDVIARNVFRDLQINWHVTDPTLIPKLFYLT